MRRWYLAILLLPTLGFADGPQFGHSDPNTAQEFENIYNDNRKLFNKRIPSILVSTITASSATFTNASVTGIAIISSASFTNASGSQLDFATGTINSFMVLATATNDNAPSGRLGQNVVSVVGNTNAPTSTQWGDLTSVYLSTGDWNVSASAEINRNGATWTEGRIGISVTSGNSGVGLVDGSSTLNCAWASSASTPVQATPSIPNLRFSLSSSTTVYFKMYAAYTASGPPVFRGRIHAIRPR